MESPESNIVVPAAFVGLIEREEIMRDFFGGWRRKLGCVTLMLALVSMGGWVRSHFYFDMLQVPLNQQSALSLNSFHKSTFLEYCSITENHPSIAGAIFPERRVEWKSHFVKRRPDDCEWIIPQVSTHRFNRLHGNGSSEKGFVTIVQMPYSTLLLPLTALSAFLLFKGPRKSDPAKTIEPVPEKVA